MPLPLPQYRMPLFQPAPATNNLSSQAKGKGRATEADLEAAFREAEQSTAMVSSTETSELDKVMDQLRLDYGKTGEEQPKSDFLK